VAQPVANEIKFAQVTDVHYSLNNTFKTKVLTDTVDSLNKRNDIAFVIFTGDNIDVAHVDNLEGFMGVIKKAEQALLYSDRQSRCIQI
jgi:predicted MPP superfamily phosphohydrolase